MLGEIGARHFAIGPDQPNSVEDAESGDCEREFLKNAIEREALGIEGQPFKIGHYTCLQRIGHGGMGVVHLARDERLNRPVALKMLKHSLINDAKASLSTEAQLMAQISHPNVAQIYEIDTVRGQSFIAMEFIDGVNLRQWWRSQSRSWNEIVDMFIQIGHGLGAIHLVGLIHRDFKPENVMIGNDRRPRVLDFGLALPADAHTSKQHFDGREDAANGSGDASTLGGRPGTIAYISPEQYAGEAIDSRSDQYSFY